MGWQKWWVRTPTIAGVGTNQIPTLEDKSRRDEIPPEKEIHIQPRRGEIDKAQGMKEQAIIFDHNYER